MGAGYGCQGSSWSSLNLDSRDFIGGALMHAGNASRSRAVVGQGHAVCLHINQLNITYFQYITGNTVSWGTGRTGAITGSPWGSIGEVGMGRICYYSYVSVCPALGR